MVFTEKELADQLFEEASAVNKKINELKDVFEYFKFQDSERANYVAIQIKTLETYLEVLNSRINFEVGYNEDESYTPEASYVCSKDSCKDCPYDPNLCLFDSDRSVTEFEDVILQPEGDDDYDECECEYDGDCESCPYADEEYDEDEDTEPEDEVYGVRVVKDGDKVSVQATPNVSDDELKHILNGLFTVFEGEPELIKKAKTPEKKIVVKKKSKKNEDEK